jgi:hypothetical protein
LHKGKWTFQITEKQNKEATSPEECIKLYGELKEEGKNRYKYECTAGSKTKGKTKVALGLLC